jgi:hypothetical protein
MLTFDWFVSSAEAGDSLSCVANLKQYDFPTATTTPSQGTRLLFADTLSQRVRETTVGSLLFVLASILCLYNLISDGNEKKLFIQPPWSNSRLPILNLMPSSFELLLSVQLVELLSHLLFSLPFSS